MIMLVLSSDAYEETFEPFHILVEKYYPNHPEIIYVTDTIKNPYYKTICKNYPLEMWTRKVREALDEIDDDIILLTIDDNFIRQPVDEERIKYIEKKIDKNTAMFNFEKSFDRNDLPSKYDRFKKKNLKGVAVNSLQCGIWNKDKLKTVLNITSTPWEIERLNISYDFDYYINSGDYIIDYGYKTFHPFGITQGKWAREVVDFFEKEGIKMDYSKRGFYEDSH